MRTMARVIAGFAILSGCFTVAPVSAEDRSTAAILKEIDDARPVPLDRSLRDDVAADREHRFRLQATWQKRDALILELYRTEPTHERVAGLMGERWGRMGAHFDDQGDIVYHKTLDDVYNDIDNILAHNPSRELKIEGLARKAWFKIHATRSTGAFDLSGIHELNEFAPGHPKMQRLLGLPFSYRLEPKAKAEVESRILKEFPDSDYAARIRSIRKRHASVGQPFELAFNDAVTGAPVSIKDLKGKVVVVEFWATWCVPCVKELPQMKALYEKYRDRGVEFIGVSLDGSEDKKGLEKVREFVAKNEVKWPQYYQGNGWDSAFSKSWGIHSIPAVFVIDQEGKLHSSDARGSLETVIAKLLKADATNARSD